MSQLYPSIGCMRKLRGDPSTSRLLKWWLPVALPSIIIKLIDHFSSFQLRIRLKFGHTHKYFHRSITIETWELLIEPILLHYLVEIGWISVWVHLWSPFHHHLRRPPGIPTSRAQEVARSVARRPSERPQPGGQTFFIMGTSWGHRVGAIIILWF